MQGNGKGPGSGSAGRRRGRGGEECAAGARPRALQTGRRPGSEPLRRCGGRRAFGPGSDRLEGCSRAACAGKGAWASSARVPVAAIVGRCESAPMVPFRMSWFAGSGGKRICGLPALVCCQGVLPCLQLTRGRGLGGCLGLLPGLALQRALVPGQEPEGLW